MILVWLSSPWRGRVWGKKPLSAQSIASTKRGLEKNLKEKEETTGKVCDPQIAS